MSKKICVEWNDSATPIADVHAYTIVDRAIENFASLPDGNTLVVQICNESTLNEFRLAVKYGRINSNDIHVLFNNQKINIEYSGWLSKWPTGFCNTIINQLTQL